MPGRATCPQMQIGEPTLPEHGAIAPQAGDGDRERLLQTSKTGEGRAPVRSGELEPSNGGIAAVPADDLPGEGVALGRPDDSQLITRRPNNAEGIPTRPCGTAPGGAASAWVPATAGCWLTAHADASDPSDDPLPRELVRGLEHQEGQAARLEVPLAESLRARLRVLPADKLERTLLDGGLEFLVPHRGSHPPRPYRRQRPCESCRGQ